MTIKLNVTLAGLAVLAICAGMAGAGLVVAGSAKAGLAAQAKASSVLVSHMSADMAHDAIRADILREILGAQGEGGISVAEAKQALAADMDLFHKSMKESRDHATDAALVAVLDKIEAPLKEYLAAADEISRTAEIDVKRAKAEFPRFQDKFHALEEAMAKASDMLRRVRIADPERVLQRYPHQLSGGMQQRVCMAMALATIHEHRTDAADLYFEYTRSESYSLEEGIVKTGSFGNLIAFDRRGEAVVLG
jgi:ABC-type uncharacterized transport system ATPase subunit